MDSFESLGQYHDFFGWLRLSAPDGFISFDDKPIDQKKTLTESFDTLRAWFHLAERKVRDERLNRIMREMIEMSYEAYTSGDSKRGARILQECEGLIWVSRTQPPKHVVEAESRAFGVVETFKHVKVTIYPYEGSKDDLGTGQQAIFDHLLAETQTYLKAQKEFKTLVFARLCQGEIKQISGKSFKAKFETIKSLASSNQINAFGFSQMGLGGESGLLSIILEEPYRPRLDIRSGLANWSITSPRYHLCDPEIFTLD